MTNYQAEFQSPINQFICANDVPTYEVFIAVMLATETRNLQEYTAYQKFLTVIASTKYLQFT
jgi:hypothetical protein